MTAYHDDVSEMFCHLYYVVSAECPIHRLSVIPSLAPPPSPSRGCRARPVVRCLCGAPATRFTGPLVLLVVDGQPDVDLVES
jgi:hypothetical protein